MGPGVVDDVDDVLMTGNVVVVVVGVVDVVGIVVKPVVVILTGQNDLLVILFDIGLQNCVLSTTP